MTVPAKPFLKPWYRRATTPEGVLLEHGRSTVSFGGAAATRLLPELLPLLDGRLTVDEIVAAIGKPARPAVENALELMATHGLLTDGPPPPSTLPVGLRRTADYLAQGAPVSPDEVASRLAASKVLLEGDGELVGVVGRLLRRCGVARARDADDASLVGTAAELAGDPVLERRNELALTSGDAWLPFGCFDGRSATVGPLVVPRETACYRCLVLRRDSTTSCRAELASLRSTPGRASMASPLVALVGALSAERIVRWLGVRDPALPGALLTVDVAPELAVAGDRVLRVPRCPACSGLAESGPPVPWHEARWVQT
ncbi:MAG: TOMM precursor leader peptide-binding protein [Gaiellaceae bacterium]